MSRTSAAGTASAAEPEETERAALEIVRHLLAGAAHLEEIVAIARALEDLELLVDRLARQADRAGPRRARSTAPCWRRRNGKSATKSRSGLALLRRRVTSSVTHRHLIAGHQHVASERLAREENAAGQSRATNRACARTRCRTAPRRCQARARGALATSLQAFRGDCIDSLPP